MVTAKDMDVVKPFNQNYSSSEVVMQKTSQEVILKHGGYSISGPIYMVD